MQIFSTGNSNSITNDILDLRLVTQGCLGGSVVERLPLAQVVILRSWDQIPHWASPWGAISPSAYVYASLSVSLINK